MRTVRPLPRKQRGIAVITAILIAALVASLAFALSARQRHCLNLLSNRNDLSAAQSIALSAIDLARLTLRDDMRSNQVDHLLEAWTVPVPPINVEEGRARGRIVELQGRFNLYNLQSGGKVSQTGVAALRRLLSAHNLPASWADKMAQAMATQEASWKKPVQLSNGMTVSGTAILLTVATLPELAELAGIDGEKLTALEPVVSILPESTSVNVNFAPPEVLMAVTPGLSLKEAERLAIRRITTHFRSGQDFVNALPENLRTFTKPATFTVESQYFLSEAEAWYGRAHVRLLALLYRQRSKMPEVVWVGKG